ncbi:MAG TPA: class I SAM-dependent methyltransferase [Acidimicrobiia bacterium]|nr:class I SAM-dependent methyltransferase [Acidimicrobiia bacterium]
MSDQAVVPNHHAHYRGFKGVSGLVAALSMAVGRENDAGFVARAGGLAPTDVVVDIGCGPGAAARHAARLGATVTGVDPAPVMLRVARMLARGPAVRFVEGTAEELPLPDASATLVWTIASVHHWGDLDAALREVQRVLQPGGRFVAVERATQPGASGLASHGWTDEQAAAFAQQCRDDGFGNVHVEHDRANRRRPLVAVVATAALRDA